MPPKPQDASVVGCMDAKITLNERIAFSSIREVTEMITREEITPAELVRETLKRMDYLADYNFIITPTPAHAEFEAVALQARNHINNGGVVFSLAMKDVPSMSKAGVIATEGSHLIATYENVPAERDSILAAALASKGGIYFGSTSLPEFGHKADTNNRVIGQTRNPHNPDFTIGGSSGGSAGAVACGIVHMATATDGAGSIVCPASFSGTVGIKPTSDLQLQPLPNSPVIKMGAQSLSKGFFTRSIEDAALILDELSNRSHGFLAALDIQEHWLPNKRVAFLPRFDYITVQEAVSDTIERALKRLPSNVNCKPVTTLGFNDPGDTPTHLWLSLYAQQYRTLDKKYSAKVPLWAEKLDKSTLALMSRGLGLSTEAVKKAVECKTDIGHKIRSFFEDYDFLITPAMPVLPWKAGLTRPDHPPFTENNAHHVAFSYPFNYSLNPTITMPCGVAGDTLYPVPVGLQVVGKVYENDPVHSMRELLRFAALCERSFRYDHWPAFRDLRFDYGPKGTCCSDV